MKKTSFATVLSIIALVLAVFAFYNSGKNKQKAGYILIADVFNGFDYKKEMEAKYTKVRNARKKILDSLQIDVSVLSRRIENKTASETDKVLFEQKRMELGQKMELFEQDNNALSKQLDSEIVKQLNQYVSDYGKENHYDLLYGNTSDGSIMYGTEQLNCTKEVIEYINAKYKGLK